MTTDYEFLVPTSYICMYKNIRVWRLWAPRWPWARVPCTLCTPYCYATAVEHKVLARDLQVEYSGRVVASYTY